MIAVHWQALVSHEEKGVLPSLQRFALALCSLPYSLVVQIRNKLFNAGLFKAQRIPVPVVVVGNLTVGGTGKTPAVEYVARFYREQGRQVALLSRGYGAQSGRNDEALVLEDNLNDVPHLQGADRVSLARTAVEELESDLLILDDGFQHRRLARDLDIVLIDATNPWGYGWCLPRGMLREPCKELHRAGAIIVTRSDQVTPPELDKLRMQIRRWAPTQPIALSSHSPVTLQNLSGEQSLDSLRGKPVAAFCGIGNPAGFWKTLQQLGYHLIARKVFPDHHGYTRQDVQELQNWIQALPADACVLTTQKDWVKLRIDELAGRPVWALRIALEIKDGQQELETTLKHVLGNGHQESVLSLPNTSLPVTCKDAYDSATHCPI